VDVRRRELWVASVLAAVCLLLALGEIGIFVAHGAPRVDRSVTTVELLRYVLQGSAETVAGLVLLARQRARVLGWILLGGALPFMLAACLSTWLRYTTAITPAVTVAVYAEALLWDIPRVVWALPGLYFPNGRLPGRWARPVLAGLVVAIVAAELVDVVGKPQWWPGTVPMANALYVPALRGVAGALAPPLVLLVSLGLLVAAVSPVTRWRRASAVTRRQIAIATPGFLLFLVVEAIRERYWSPWVAVAVLVVAVLWPAAVGYVIVRDRLYVLDRTARRVVAGAVPVGLLVAVYLAAAVVMSAALPGEGAALAATLAVLAALVGLVLRPISVRVSRLVDRLLYGDRAEPYQVARQLAARLREGVASAQVPEAVCQIVVNALRLPGAALEATSGRLAAVGAVDRNPALESFELRYQGQCVGRLLVAPRNGQDHLDELDRAVLQPLADLAGPAVSALSLRQELEESRARLVTARETERHRLRRDVHDGIGPALAGIGLRVDTAAALLPHGSPSAPLLADVSEDLREIVAEMRRITEDMRPPALEMFGLAGALGALVERLSSPALPIALVLPNGLPQLPGAVELAAYRIVAEALTNVIRHAAATGATVRVTASVDTLVVTVVDNGVGIRPGRVGHGLGLRSMAERAGDLGGACEVHGGRGGTTLTARLPLGQDARVAVR
jgi:signal transduction histidine kinase